MAALAVLVTVVLTYPLAFKLGSIGRVNTNDGRFSIWNVAWVGRTVVADPVHLFDANIFYPHRDTLAFSEMNIGAGLLAAPVYMVTNNPYAAHNAVVLMAFVLAVLGGYYLVRYLTASRAAGALAGVLFAFCPYVFGRTAQIQLMMTAGLPWALLAFHRLIDRLTVARASALVVVLVAQALACGYYGVFAGLMIGLAALYYAGTRRLWTSGRYWSLLFLTAILSVVTVLPFFLPFVRLAGEGAYDGGRSLEDARRFAADWRAYWPRRRSHTGGC